MGSNQGWTMKSGNRLGEALALHLASVGALQVHLAPGRAQPLETRVMQPGALPGATKLDALTKAPAELTIAARGCHKRMWLMVAPLSAAPLVAWLLQTSRNPAI